MFASSNLKRIALVVGCLSYVANGQFDCATKPRCVFLEYEYTEPPEEPTADIIQRNCGKKCDDAITCSTRSDCVDELKDLAKQGSVDVDDIDDLESCTDCIVEIVEAANATRGEETECGSIPEDVEVGDTVEVGLCLPAALASVLMQKSCCTDGFCFSAASQAFVENVHRKMQAVLVKDLQVGDKVLTSSGNYETVYTIDHQNPNKLAEFIQIFSTGGVAPLEVTEDHMVFLHGKETPLPARSIKVGDALQSVTASPSIVTKISSVERKGIWNPITTDGTIVVDGIVASTYSTHFGADNGHIEIAGTKIMSHHDFFHRLMSPYRAVCLGLSLSFCESKEEFTAYSQLGVNILESYRVQNEFVQDIFVFVFLHIAFAFHLFSLAMNPLVVTGLVLGTGSYYFYAKN